MVTSALAPALRRAPVWAPQPRQHCLISCPVPDVLYGGARGGGKSEGLLGDWMAHAARYGAHARGLFLRQSYPELEEIERRCHELFPACGARWLATRRTWLWPSGARLRLRYMQAEQDAQQFQGQSNTWIGIDEAGNYRTLLGIDTLRATLRSAQGVPCFLRLTANPGGVAHHLLKSRYVDPAPSMQPFTTTETIGGVVAVTVQRVYIPATLDDNQLLTKADPTYWQRVAAAAGGREDLLRAWRYGDWTALGGTFFGDVWDSAWHVLEPFPVPRSWRIRRAFDWGSSKPYSVGWWAHCDGEAPGSQGRVYPRGTRIRVMELYGWNGQPNEGLRSTNTEIARRIAEVEAGSPYAGRIEAGPADTQIFDVINGRSIADEMATYGVKWLAAQKGPGSRRQGWQLIRQLLKAGSQWPMEEPGLFVFSTCRQFLRTVPPLPRDARDAEDVDSDAEDHAGDELRYECSIPLMARGGTLAVRGY